MFKKKNTFVSHLFGSTVFADVFFFLNTAWCRIAADIKVKVKHARRLEARYLKPEEKRENKRPPTTVIPL